MLKMLNVLHTPELLHILASMGHGDEIAIVDCNFPAVSMGQRVVRLDGATLAEVLEACMQLLPLDSFVPEPAIRMEQVHAPHEIPPVQQECQEIIDQAEGKHVPLAGISREDFYQRSRQAFAVLITGERRPYGCILLKKGVIVPDSAGGPPPAGIVEECLPAAAMATAEGHEHNGHPGRNGR